MLHEAVELAAVPLEYLRTRMLGIQRMLSGFVKLEYGTKSTWRLVGGPEDAKWVTLKTRRIEVQKMTVELWTWLWALWNI